MAEEIDFEFDPGALDDLLHDSDAEALMQVAGDAVAVSAAADAPKRTGAGAASIHAEVDSDTQSAYADVSWTPERFYLYFAEVGTEHESARPFLRPALDSTTI